MARVIDEDVQSIYTGDGNVSVAIIAAHNLVESTLLSCGYTEDELKEFERWLAAHFASSTEGGEVKSEQLSDWQIEYATKGGKGLEATMFGQQAIAMDRCGKLASLSKRKANFDVL